MDDRIIEPAKDNVFVDMKSPILYSGITTTMSKVVSKNYLPSDQAHFYFPIGKKGITNYKDELVERIDRFTIRFNQHLFVSIDIKLYKVNDVYLTTSDDRLLDIGSGRCVNMKWVGVVNAGLCINLMGDDNMEGYWMISIL